MPFDIAGKRWVYSIWVFGWMLFGGSWFSNARADSVAPERPVYTIAVGQNEVPASLAEAGSHLAALHYADDDATQLHLLMSGLSRGAFLLTVLDSETQARFPDAARAALTPTLAELERTVELVRVAMEADRARGLEPTLVFFYSGHGVSTPGGAALALFDGVMTQSFLYEKVLARLPARYVHLIIDACHAGAVVRSRDVNAKLEPLAPAEIAAYLKNTSLAAFPHVGAILASTASTQSFEWDAYRGGVFAHELLSALRGAADVNGDGRIEYSELAAFFSAVNLQVGDPRARLHVVVEPPRSNARAPVLDHAFVPGQFRLLGRSDGIWARPFYVESANGARLLDVFPERGTKLALWLPAGETLYVVSGDQEISLSAAAGTQIQLATLKPSAGRNRSRGALDEALRRGLFRTPYGPAFYRGFTSQREELVPIALDSELEDWKNPTLGQRDQTPTPPAPKTSVRKPIGYGLLVSAGAAAVAAGVFTGAALSAHAEYDAAEYERPAAAAEDRLRRYQTAAWVCAGTALGLAGSGALLILWPDPKVTQQPSRAPVAVRFFPAGVVVKGAF